MPPILKSRVTRPACIILVFMWMMPKLSRNGSRSFIRKALPKPGRREPATPRQGAPILMVTCSIFPPGAGVKNCCRKKKAALALENNSCSIIQGSTVQKYSSKTSHVGLPRLSEDDDRVRSARGRQEISHRTSQENCRVNSEVARAKPCRTECRVGGRSGNAPAQRQVPQEEQDYRCTFVSRRSFDAFKSGFARRCHHFRRASEASGQGTENFPKNGNGHLVDSRHSSSVGL